MVGFVVLAPLSAHAQDAVTAGAVRVLEPTSRAIGIE